MPRQVVRTVTSKSDGIHIGPVVLTQIYFVNFTFFGPCIVNQCQWMFNNMRLYTVYYISVNCSTCFGWYLHPTSGAHITVITASGSSNSSAIAKGSSNSLTSSRCCNYSYMCSWWWVEIPPETCTALYKNIINCIQGVTGGTDRTSGGCSLC